MANELFQLYDVYYHIPKKGLEMYNSTDRPISTSGTTTEPRRLTIQDRITELEKIVAVLTKALSELGYRLNPVSLTIHPEPMSDEDHPATREYNEEARDHESSVARRIVVIQEDVRRLCEFISKLRMSLDL